MHSTSSGFYSVSAPRCRRNASGEKEVGGQADHGFDVAVFEQFGADTFFSASSEQQAMEMDSGHHAAFAEEVEAVQQIAR